MRQVRFLNRNWKFAYGKYGPQERNEVETWSDVGLPHSFGIPYFMENDFYVGYGCYFREIQFSKHDLKKRILLEFLGSFQVTEVFFNGALVGRHEGGYTSFVVELTDLIKVGTNALFLRVNNEWNPQLAPRAGEHQFNGGVYRDVQLILTGRSCVDWMGIFVKTTAVKKKTASIRVETTVCVAGKAGSAVLESEVRYRGFTIGREAVVLSFTGKQTVMQEFQIADPDLWMPESPRLYELITRVLVGREESDREETRFGIRTMRFDAHKGFFLNGQHYDILGANVHQDHAGWADAVTRTGITRDLQTIKDCGMNFVRGSHYPHHPFFAAECDRIGLLFWSELCFWGTGGLKQEGYWTASAYPIHEEDQEPFEQSCLRALEEMILVNRNHPSILAWSVCNEPFFTDDTVLEQTKALVKRLVNRSHELDPTRVAAVGGAQRSGFDVLGDVAGYNGDGASLYHDPGFPNFVSEYGSVASFRPGKFAPNYTDQVEMPHRWRSGKALWCGFHHGSILGDMGAMGMVDYYRLPLNIWHWYRQHLLGMTPPPARPKGVPCRMSLTSDVVQVGTEGHQDAWLYLEVLDRDGQRLSNEFPVTLKIISGDGILPTGKEMHFSPQDNSFLDGQAAIEFRSYYGGETVLEASAEGVLPARLTITAVGKPRRHKLVPMQPPPGRMPAPYAKEAYNLAVHKPVFASSYQQGHAPSNITTAGNGDWLPEHAENAWIKLDLEGNRRITKIDLRFAEEVGQTCVLYLSADDQEYHPLSLVSEYGYYTACGEWVFRYAKLMGEAVTGTLQQIRVWAEQ